MAEKILIVDDEVDTLRLVGLMLERQGYEIIAAENGEQALEEVEKDAPDLILLDVMMPGMDGPTTLKNLKQVPGLEQTPVIFLTAKVQPNEIQDYIDLGAVDVIAKPFDSMKLADQIHDILKQNGK